MTNDQLNAIKARISERERDATCCGYADEAALLAEFLLLRDAVSGVVNEGWVDFERCESKMGADVAAAMRRACE